MNKKLTKYVGKYKKYVILTPLCVMAQCIMELAIPFIMAKMIDVGIRGTGGINYTIMMGLAMTLIAILSLTFGVLGARYAALASSGYAKNLRSALFTYLTAKSMGGKFILRIEDTDQERKVEGAVEFILNTLNMLGLHPDEGAGVGGDFGPYYQSERLDIYKKYAEELVEKGDAYYCFCDEERLEKLREIASARKVPFTYDGHCSHIPLEEARKRIANGEKYVIRQKMPKEGVTSYIDTVYGEIKVENSALEDQILIKSDGFPTYNFANVIDDHLMKISHVNRGNE